MPRRCSPARRRRRGLWGNTSSTCRTDTSSSSTRGLSERNHTTNQHIFDSIDVKLNPGKKNAILLYWIFPLYRRIIKCRCRREFWLFQLDIDVTCWVEGFGGRRPGEGGSATAQPTGLLCHTLLWSFAWLLYTFRPSGLSFCWECNCQNLLDCFYNGRPELGLAGPWWWKDRELTSYYSAEQTTLSTIKLHNSLRHQI